MIYIDLLVNYLETVLKTVLIHGTDVNIFQNILILNSG